MVFPIAAAEPTANVSSFLARESREPKLKSIPRLGYTFPCESVQEAEVRFVKAFGFFTGAHSAVKERPFIGSQLIEISFILFHYDFRF